MLGIYFNNLDREVGRQKAITRRPTSNLKVGSDAHGDMFSDMCPCFEWNVFVWNAERALLIRCCRATNVSFVSQKSKKSLTSQIVLLQIVINFTCDQPWLLFLFYWTATAITDNIILSYDAFYPLYAVPSSVYWKILLWSQIVCI